jgi:hypothetical protein
MNGNVASSPIKNNFLPIIDRWSAVISSPVQIRHAYDFSLCFLHELLMSFLSLYTILYITSLKHCIQ